jgi:hypothetical protein
MILKPAFIHPQIAQMAQIQEHASDEAEIPLTREVNGF